MDTVPSSRKPRFDLRLRRRTTNQPASREHNRRYRNIQEKEEDSALEARDDSKQPLAMTQDHRMFHRRAPQVATQVVTVAVEVVATVDTNGNVVGQETVLPQAPSLPTNLPVPAVPVVSEVPLQSVVAQALPSDPAVVALAASLPEVPAVPTPAVPALPQVPSVPPFPSDLKVPAVPSFPWPSGDPIAAAAAASANSAAATPAPSTEAAIPSESAANASLSPAVNSPATSAALAASSSVVLPESELPSSSPTSSLSSSPNQSSQASSGLSRSGSPTATADPTATNYYGTAGAPGNPVPTSSTVPAADSQASAAPTPLETPQVVGSVIGSLAGAALILAILLILLRRHKRKRGGALQLTGDDRIDRDQQSMRQTQNRSSLIPAGFLNRFSSMSKSTADTSTTGERSFQRVSGRKLPSAFSEGMTSDQFSRGGTMSGSSFYQDDQGTYGGMGYSKEFGKEIGESSNYRGSGPMNFRPSPARTPVIRHADDENPFSNKNRITSHLSPPQSPNPDFPPTRGTLGRSLPSADGSRSSRFTENV